MDDVNNKQYCQSCGMPLRFDVEAYLGTNADCSLSDEYCYYCLKEGKYIVDISMEQMIEIWIKYTDKYNWYSDTDYSQQELRILLKKRLPTLKRWQQREMTLNVHHEAINRVKTYIEQNLFAELDGMQLVMMSNLSFFHFRRVFKSITNENVGTYIQRLRLEYIAHLLMATDLSLTEILQQTNYHTNFSLAKAFKKHFGVSMSVYRTKYKTADSIISQAYFLQSKIKRLNTQQALCLHVGDAFRNEAQYKAIWTQLAHYRVQHLKQDGNFISISQDNTLITSENQCRFFLGIIISENIIPKGKFVLQLIRGGMYAVFTHKGSYDCLPEMYQTLYEQWLPQSGYYQKYPSTFEIYLNSPRETTTDELLTEIYIPIEKL